jgi:hypothetical protein
MLKYLKLGETLHMKRDLPCIFNIFFMFIDRFDILILKINLKNKNNII